MRILNAFNMAQDAYNITLAMRARGVEADLLVREQSDVFSTPAWEDGRVNRSAVGDILKASKSAFESWEKPPWVKVWPRMERGFFAVACDFWRARKLFQEYDVVFCHAPSSMYGPWTGVPYVPYDGGLIRYLHFAGAEQRPFYRGKMNPLAVWLWEHSYRKAKKIIYTNPDTFRFFQNGGLEEKLVFCPFAVDTTRYRPKPTRKAGDIFTVFSPSRQSWAEKGNDKLIRAFARFLKTRPDAKLVLVEWGQQPYLQASKDLIAELAIEKSVTWVPPMPKPDLIDAYNGADVVADQFVLGSWGTATPEAMACAKPVIMYYDEAAVNRCFGRLPPFPSAQTEDEILRDLNRYLDPETRAEVGRRCREWVMETHSPDLVVDIHLRVADEVTA